MSEIAKLRRAMRKALRLLDDGLGDTDMPFDDPFTRAYRVLDRALAASTPERDPK